MLRKVWKKSCWLGPPHELSASRRPGNAAGKAKPVFTLAAPDPGALSGDFRFGIRFGFTCLSLESKLGTKLDTGPLAAASSRLAEPLLSRGSQWPWVAKHLYRPGGGLQTVKVALRGQSGFLTGARKLI